MDKLMYVYFTSYLILRLNTLHLHRIHFHSDQFNSTFSYMRNFADALHKQLLASELSITSCVPGGSCDISRHKTKSPLQLSFTNLVEVVRHTEQK